MENSAYQSTLEWMFSRLPMFQKSGKSALKHKLDNISNFCEYLDNPQLKIKTLHVGGTNGKGSSSHMIASILQEAGYKTGLYTSPHLRDFRERIKINGIEISKKEVVEFISKHKTFLEENSLSFFEMSVAMAFYYFAKQKIDIAVIEVGLGGRLDSTNIISPEVSLITNIGMDHTDILGDTLEKIAYEKAGIIKSNIPIVISEYKKQTADVFKNVAKEKQSPIIFASKIPYLKKYKLDLEGNYQQKNVKGVLATVKQLQKKGWNISEKAIEKGLSNTLKNTHFKGRWQQIGSKPNIICDTAHNKEGLTIVLEQLKKQTYDRLHIVIGFVKDKDLSILEKFPKEATYYFTEPQIERKLPVSELLKIATQYKLKGKKCTSVKQALREAKKNACKNDFIYIGGSTFVVAEII